jgi:hypothetical protein
MLWAIWPRCWRLAIFALYPARNSVDFKLLVDCTPDMILSWIRFSTLGTVAKMVGRSATTSSMSFRLLPWKNPMLAPCTNRAICQRDIHNKDNS